MSIEIRSGSILDFEGDCIVNPANSFMNHGGGLARIIAQAAMEPREGENPFRPTEFESENRRLPLTATGNIAVTSAGALPFKGIIHAVGPIWNGGDFMEHDLLEIVTERALEEAASRNWLNIAFPAISCGIFGFPVEEAARILVQVAWGWEPQFDTLAFYPFGHELVFEDAVEQFGS